MTRMTWKDPPQNQQSSQTSQYPPQKNKPTTEHYILAKRYLDGEPSEEGKEALWYLLDYHQRLVKHLIKRFAPQKLIAEAYDDLFHEGMLTLLEAIKRYDPERGVAFTTFAFPLLRYAVQRATSLLNSYIASSPYVRRLYIHAEQTRLKITLEKNEQPTLQELAEALSVGEEALAKALTLSQTPARLVYESGDREGEERDIPSQLTHYVEELNERPMALIAGLIDFLLETLPKESAKVLRLYLGIDGPPLGLYQIADKLGISRHRAKTLLTQALNEARSRLAVWEAVESHYDFVDHLIDSYRLPPRSG